MSESPKRRAPTYDRSLSAEQRRDAQRTRILNAAVEAFGATRSERAVLDVIVARASVSRRTLYLHFEDLDALRVEAFAHALGLFAPTIVEAALAEQDDDPLRVAVARIADLVETQPSGLRFVLTALNDEDARIVASRNVLVETLTNIWVTRHNEGYAQGRTPKPMTRLEAEQWLAMLRGIVVRAFEHDTAEARRQLLLGFVDMVHAAHPFGPPTKPA